jgi:hypothetical protein
MSCSKCNKNNNEQLSECQINAYNYANKQNTFYDEKNNRILYGFSSLMKPSGVSDGTCNQLNPLMTPCGLGSAGGNPCFPNTIEPFENSGHKCNINGFITLIFLILILVLFININYHEYYN